MNNNTNGAKDAHKSASDNNNPNNSAKDPSQRWRMDINDPRVIRHASKCQYHGQLYQDALNANKK